jgi:hypothetical protein
MKTKQTRKVSFRLSPSASEGLELLAQCDDMTVADFLRGCVSYALTSDRAHLPRFLNEGLDFPAVDDAEGWVKVLEEL